MISKFLTLLNKFYRLQKCRKIVCQLYEILSYDAVANVLGIYGCFERTTASFLRVLFEMFHNPLTSPMGGGHSGRVKCKE
jgi:hypothetical protein